MLSAGTAHDALRSRRIGDLTPNRTRVSCNLQERDDNSTRQSIGRKLVVVGTKMGVPFYPKSCITLLALPACVTWSLTLPPTLGPP